MSVTVEYALRYAALGWRIIPCYWPIGRVCACYNAKDMPISESTERFPCCGKRIPRCACGRIHELKGIGKHPIYPKWREIATTNPDTIRSWIVNRPQMNIGIVCGAESGIFVLDIDGTAGERSLNILTARHGELPPTPIFVTGGNGLHYIFRYPEHMTIPTKTRIVDGVDIRGDGGQIIAPPGRNAYGDYDLSSIAAPIGFESVPGIEQCYPVADAPPWLLTLISAGSVQESQATHVQRYNIFDALNGVPEGQRDDALFRLACKMRDEDIPQELALDWIRRAAQNCTPPFPIALAEEKVNRAYRKYTPRMDWSQVISPTTSQKHSSEWTQPAPLTPHTGIPFPDNILPSWLQQYVQFVAQEIQVPTSMVAPLVLASVSACVAKKGVIRITPTWREPLNLYIVVACPPSSRKSPTFSAVTAPLIEYQKSLMDQYEQQRAAAQFERDALKLRLDRAKKDFARMPSGTTPVPEDILLMQKRINELSNIDLPRILADDVTPERLAGLLFSNHERIAILSAEGNDIFKQMGAKYKSVADPTLYIKGWSGDVKIVDRMGRTEYLRNPIITMGIAIQPRLLRGIAESEAADQGLLARILYVLPEDIVGRRVIPYCPKTADETPIYRYQKIYTERLLRLLQLPLPERQIGIDGHVFHTAHTLNFDDDALETFLQYERQLEVLRGETVDEDQREWLGKLGGQTARIIGVLHLLEAIDYCDEALDVWNVPISGETTECGIRLALWFKAHAESAFREMRSEPVHGHARHLLRWITEQSITEFRKSDALKVLNATGSVITYTLRYLIDRGYIRSMSGRMIDENTLFEVNPHVHHQKPKNSGE